MVEKCEAVIASKKKPNYMLLSGQNLDIEISCEECPFSVEKFSYEGESMFVDIRASKDIGNFLEQNCRKWNQQPKADKTSADKFFPKI